MKWILIKDGKIIARYAEFSDAIKTYIKINGDKIIPCEIKYLKKHGFDIIIT